MTSDPRLGQAGLVCGSCAWENQPAARFCANCGTALAAPCPNCQQMNPRESRFCSNCGWQLQPGAGPAGRQPPPSSPPAPAPAGDIFTGERRIVTILFADVVDSTALAESMDPEDWRTLMNEAFARLSSAITLYGGTIARLMGDAVLAFFGAPAAHEDDPGRTIRAGLEMIATAREFSSAARRDYGVDFNIRVGINTGPVVVGLVGSPQAQEYTAMGDAVNLAARLQNAARPMSVLISEAVYRQVMSTVEASDLGQIPVKGKAEPVRVYQVEGFRPGSASGRLLSGGFVGRVAELAALQAASAAVLAGLSRAVVILGDPGIGKTRLVTAWRTGLCDLPGAEGRTPRWIEGHCPSYGQATAYHLVSDWLHSLLQVPAAAPASQKQSSLRELCAAHLAGPDDEGYRFLAHLLSLPLDPADLRKVESLDSPAVQFKYLTHLHRLLASLAQSEPVQMILDDLHWADPSSVDLLVQLLPLLQDSPILVCCVSRPDRDSPGWRLISAVRELHGPLLTEISLAPLSPAENTRLVEAILGSQPSAAALPGVVYQKAEGNPLFTEEVLRMLVDQGALQRSGSAWGFSDTSVPVEIPDQLQGLLLARVDRLPDEVRKVLRIAAVIGRGFPLPVLERVLQAGPEPALRTSQSLNRLLSGVESAGLITLSKVHPELVYTFRHSLVQEAVYDSILKADRRQLHRRVADAWESSGAARREELSATLARHLLLSGEESRALDYLVHAADSAFVRYALQEALAAYRQAVQIVQRVKTESRLVNHLYTRLGRVLELNSDNPAALHVYQEMERVALEQADTPLRLSAILLQAALHAGLNVVNDAGRSQELCEEALRIAAELNDRASEARAYWILQLQHSRSNRLQQGLYYGEKALALARELGLRELEGYALNDLSESYFSNARFDDARTSFSQAQTIWRELGIQNMLSDNLSTATLMYFITGEFESGLKSSAEAFQISQSIGNLWGIAYSRMYVGFIHGELGQIDQAISTMREVIQAAEKAGFIAPLVSTRADLASWYAYAGMFDQAKTEIEQALAQSANRLTAWQSWVRASLARVQYYSGDMVGLESTLSDLRDDIEDASPQSMFLNIALFHGVELDYTVATFDYERAVRIHRRFEPYEQKGMLVFHPDIHHAIGVCLLARGELDAAAQHLRLGLDSSTRLGSLRSRWPILAALVRLARLRGDPAQAESCQAELDGVLAVLSAAAKNAGSPRDFRSLPWVQKVLALDFPPSQSGLTPAKPA